MITKLITTLVLSVFLLTGYAETHSNDEIESSDDQEQNEQQIIDELF